MAVPTGVVTPAPRGTDDEEQDERNNPSEEASRHWKTSSVRIKEAWNSTPRLLPFGAFQPFSSRFGRFLPR